MQDAVPAAVLGCNPRSQVDFFIPAIIALDWSIVKSLPIVILSYKQSSCIILN